MKDTNPASIDFVQELNADLWLPIAFRKGTRACIQHPMSRFMSYQRLSSKLKFFSTKLEEESIPKNMHEALHISNGDRQ